MKQLKLLFSKTMYVMNRPQKWLCVIVFLMTCFGSVLECIGVSVIIPLVNMIQNPDSILQSSFFQEKKYLSNLNYQQVVMFISGSIIALYLIKNMYFIFLSWVRVKFSGKIQREMAIKMLTSYLSRGYQFFLIKNYGEFNRGVRGDTSAVYTVLNSVFKLLAEFLTIFLICLFMFFADWSLAMAMVILAGICLFFIYFLFRKSMYKNGERGREYGGKIEQTMIQTYYGVKDMLLLRKQKHFIKEYEKNQIQIQLCDCKTTVGSESPAYIIEGICVAGLMFVVCMRVMAIEDSASFIAILASFAVGAFRILPSLGRISTSLNMLTTSLPSIEALYGQIREAEEYAKVHPEVLFSISEKTSKWGLISRGSDFGTSQEDVFDNEMIKFRDKLELRSISFRYANMEENVLENVSLTVKKGQSIAFIGASGAGKSTLSDILLGLLLPQEGEILMDGVKITDIPEKWARTVGYVPQSVFLSDVSIKENVAFGENDENIDVDRVIEALDRAELSEFISSLQEGIETLVGDSGVRLSGGQRQRIAIARALYHRPEIMVLDEATSALDSDTEAAIMSAIESLQGEVTLIIIAHRLTTVKSCDVIYEVADKEIRVRDKNEVLSGI